MKIPFKMSLLLWFVNRDRSSQLYRHTPEKARKVNVSKGKMIDRFLDDPAIAMHQVADMDIAGRSCDIPVRVYQSVAGNDLPVIMYFHGGGFVISNIETHDKICRRLARDNKAVVVSVEYRLAPEHKYPAAVHDAYDATAWVAKNASSINGDSNRLIVMGDSAGGNLATAVCLMSRDLGGPKIHYQVLIYPVTDGTLSSPSIKRNGQGYLLTEKLLRWFTDHYKSKDEDLQSPYFSMLLAEDLSNLPPAFILTAEYDPLLDEGRRYAERLEEAGVAVTYKNYEGMIHAFISMPKLSKQVLQAYSDIQDAIAKVV